MIGLHIKYYIAVVETLSQVLKRKNMIWTRVTQFLGQ